MDFRRKGGPTPEHHPHFFAGCMYNASKGMLCDSSCNVEGDMLKTIASVKALNPSVLGIM